MGVSARLLPLLGRSIATIVVLGGVLLVARALLKVSPGEMAVMLLQLKMLQLWILFLYIIASE